MDSSLLLRTVLVFLGFFFFALTGCSPEKSPWVVWPVTGYPLKLINHTPFSLGGRTAMLKSRPTSPRTRYELDDYNPDHSPNLFILEVIAQGTGNSDKIKAHIVADGFKYKMNHVIQEGAAIGAGIWTFERPASDYKMSSNTIPYYFVVEQVSGTSKKHIEQKLGSAEEPFTVKLSPNP